MFTKHTIDRDKDLIEAALNSKKIDCDFHLLSQKSAVRLEFILWDKIILQF